MPKVDSPPSAATRLALPGLMLLALVLRLGWGLHQPSDDAGLAVLPDQVEYLQLARNLLHGRGLVLHDDRFGQDVRAYRTPGYPVFVAACGGDVRVCRVVQSIVDTSTVLAAYLLALRWLGRRWGLVAAAFVAINPFLIYFSGTLLTETLFTAMLIWGMVLMRWNWLVGTVVLAVSVLVRPAAAVLPALLVLLNPQGEQRIQFRRALVAVAVTGSLLLPWAYRNYRVLGQWVWTTTNNGITSYDGCNPAATGGSDQRFVGSMPQLRTMSEVEREREFAKRAGEFVVKNPGRVAQLACVKVARTWSPMPLSSEFGDWKHVLVGLLYSVPLDILIVLGLVGRGMPGSVKLFLLAPALYVTLIHAASVGSLRYRIPVEPPLAVLAAAGAARFAGRRE